MILIYRNDLRLSVCINGAIEILQFLDTSFTCTEENGDGQFWNRQSRQWNDWCNWLYGRKSKLSLFIYILLGTTNINSYFEL